METLGSELDGELLKEHTRERALKKMLLTLCMNLAQASEDQKARQAAGHSIGKGGGLRGVCVQRQGCVAEKQCLESGPEDPHIPRTHSEKACFSHTIACKRGLAFNWDMIPG